MALIRDAVLHLQNEQPLLADLFSVPTSADACVVCTNVRTLAGKRPLFVDRMDSIFLFPLEHVRFVEVPVGSTGGFMATLGAGEGGEPEEIPVLEIDEDLMRRIRES
jgi:hypothetical protein